MHLFLHRFAQVMKLICEHKNESNKLQASQNKTLSVDSLEKELLEPVMKFMFTVYLSICLCLSSLSDLRPVQTFLPQAGILQLVSI